MISDKRGTKVEAKERICSTRRKSSAQTFVPNATGWLPFNENATWKINGEWS